MVYSSSVLSPDFTGQGLGREKNGIANPIKVKIKRDSGGVSAHTCTYTEP